MTDTTVETSLEDDIRAAMGEVEKADDKEIESAPERPRDEKGKFVAKEGETETEAAARLQPEAEKKPDATETKEPAPTEGQQQEAHLLTEDKAPRGWAPAIREKWGTIPEEIRKEILRREEASAIGVRQLQENYAPLEQFVGSIAPFIQEARQNGVAPDQYIGSVLASERILRRADLPTKFQEILRIADQYGVPLRDIINASVGQEVLTKPQQQAQQYVPPQVAQELAEARQWREQFEQRSITNELNAFSQGREFFEDVRSTMALYVESGQAKSLQDAYDAACWATPAVRDVLLSRQGKQQEQTDLQKRQEAAAGASVKPKGEVDVKVGDKDDDDDDIAATVRKAFAESATGRI